jgi:hypothetical protein
VKPEVPFVASLLSWGVTAMATPLTGLVEFTVSTYVVAGALVVVGEFVLVPPPQAVINRLSPIPSQAAAFFRRDPMEILSFAQSPVFSQTRLQAEITSWFFHSEPSSGPESSNLRTIKGAGSAL